MTLHDLDLANAMPRGQSGSMMTLVNQMLKPKKTEITERLRQEVNQVVNDYIEQVRFSFVCLL